MHRTILIVFVISLLSTTAKAQIYKCQDSSGNILYTSKPCNVESVEILNVIDNRVSLIDSHNVIQNGTVNYKGQVNPSLEVEESIEGQLLKQRQLGMKISRDYVDILTVGNQPKTTGERAGQRDYAKHLKKSSAILINSSVPSQKGVDLIVESNKIASKLLNESSTSARAAIRDRAAHLQLLATAQLGAPI